MKIFKWTIGKKKQEPIPAVETSRTIAAPTNLSPEEANSCHKILALISGPAQILGTPIKAMNNDELKAMFRLSMAQVHCGPGYKEEHVDYVTSGQYQIDQEALKTQDKENN